MDKVVKYTISLFLQDVDDITDNNPSSFLMSVFLRRTPLASPTVLYESQFSN